MLTGKPTRREKLNFKDIFLENLEQDRYGLTSDRDEHDEDKKVIFNIGTSLPTTKKRVIVPLPNIDILNNKVDETTTLRSRSTEEQPYTSLSSGYSMPRKYWQQHYTTHPTHSVMTTNTPATDKHIVNIKHHVRKYQKPLYAAQGKLRKRSNNQDKSVTAGLVQNMREKQLHETQGHKGHEHSKSKQTLQPNLLARKYRKRKHKIRFKQKENKHSQSRPNLRNHQDNVPRHKEQNGKYKKLTEHLKIARPKKLKYRRKRKLSKQQINNYLAQNVQLHPTPYPSLKKQSISEFSSPKLPPVYYQTNSKLRSSPPPPKIYPVIPISSISAKPALYPTQIRAPTFEFGFSPTKTKPRDTIVHQNENNNLEDNATVFSATAVNETKDPNTKKHDDDFVFKQKNKIEILRDFLRKDYNETNRGINTVIDERKHVPHIKYNDEYYSESSSNGFVYDYDNDYYAKIINKEIEKDSQLDLPFLNYEDYYQSYNDISNEKKAENIHEIDMHKNLGSYLKTNQFVSNFTELKNDEHIGNDNHLSEDSFDLISRLRVTSVCGPKLQTWYWKSPSKGVQREKQEGISGGFLHSLGVLEYTA